MVESENKRKHEPVEQRTREQVEAMLASGDSAKTIKALWSAAYYDPDWRWVQTQCLLFLTHADLWIRRNAATCLGLVAVFHKKLDQDLVVPALKKAAEDPDLKPWAEDSLGDIQHTFKVQ
ncbi:MAG TPA: hypothetical protein VI488_05930 [Candidatus Angelobacter sp.]